MIRKITSLILSLGLLFQQVGFSYAVGELNLANYLSAMPRAIIQPDRFRPPQLRYISYDLKSDDFKLLLDKGDLKQPKEQNGLNDKLLTQELLNYFLIGLSLPNDTFWVNLRPDAADNIIDPLLEKTDIGRIFLESDLQLKKDTASFTSPQTPEGKVYWDKLYKKAGELFGTENITIPTITRPWIVPNEVIVRETDDSAYIYKATLKVMLEEDYLKSSQSSAFSNQQYNFNDPRLKELNQYSTQLIKETIIPKLTQEVNSSQRYAKLRQVYYSLVLSRWFKMKYQGKPGQYPELIDRQNLTNLTSPQAWDKQTYFSQYQESFAKGEYNLKETIASPFGQSIRSYVSGGISVGSPINKGVVKVSGSEAVTNALTGSVTGGPVSVGSPLQDNSYSVRTIPLSQGARLKLENLKKYFYENLDKLFSKEETFMKSVITTIKELESFQELFVAVKVIKNKAEEDVIERHRQNPEEIIGSDPSKSGRVQSIKEIIRNSGQEVAEIAKYLKKEVDDYKTKHGLSNTDPFHSLLFDGEFRVQINALGAVAGFMEVILSVSSDVASPLNTQQFYDKLKTTYHNEEFFRDGEKAFIDLINIFSQVDKKAELGKDEAKFIDLIVQRIIEKHEEELMAHLDPVFFILYSTIYLKTSNHDAEENVTIEEVLNVIVARLRVNLIELAHGAVGKHPIAPDKRASFSAINDKFISAVKKAQEKISQQKQPPAGSPLTVEEVKPIIEELKMLDDVFSIDISNNEKDLFEKLESLRKNISDMGELMEIQINSEQFKFLSEKAFFMYSIKTWCELILEELQIFVPNKKNRDMREIDENKLQQYLKSHDDADKKVQSFIMAMNEFNKAYIAFEIKNKINEFVIKQGLSADISIKWEKEAYVITRIVLKGEIPEAFDFQPLADDLTRLRDARIGFISGKFTESNVFVMYLTFSKRLPPIAQEKAQEKTGSGSPLGEPLYDENDKIIPGLRFVSYADIKENKEMIKDIMDRLNRKAFVSIDGKSSVYFSTRYTPNIANMLFAVELDGFGKIVELKGMLQIAGGKIETLGGETKEIAKALEKKAREIVSSAIVAVPQTEKRGGIDLTDRAMHINLERVGSFADLKLMLPGISNMETIDLDNEFKQIQAMVSSSIRPSDTRILEFAAACYYKREFDQRLTQITDCIKNAHLADEGLGKDSSDTLRLATMLPDALYSSSLN
ncbi:MAG: hypothetical protein Q7J72_04825 [Candidatus Omnitrophota bacterium]|nr:hypothetical protein [Candidatus Omnitrophota bacterium]